MNNKKLMLEILEEEQKLHKEASRQGYNVDWEKFDEEMEKIYKKATFIQAETDKFLSYGDKIICIHDSFFEIKENKILNHYETKIKTSVLAYEQNRNESSFKIDMLIRSKTTLRFLNNREIYKFLIVPEDKIFAVSFFEGHNKKISPVIDYLTFEIKSYQEVE